jgi:hypothetical protein
MDIEVPRRPRRTQRDRPAALSGAVSLNLLFVLYYLFKLSAPIVSGIAIYLGYNLFILGVTGQASLSVESKSVGAQLINAAPGLFFALGGLTALVFSVLKGVQVGIRPEEIVLHRMQ